MGAAAAGAVGAAVLSWRVAAEHEALRPRPDAWRAGEATNSHMPGRVLEAADGYGCGPALADSQVTAALPAPTAMVIARLLQPRG